MFEFSILPEKKILLSNGTELNEPLCLLSGIDESLDEEDRYKLTRGIMLQVENETYWKDCLECFSSYPKVVKDGEEEKGA